MQRALADAIEGEVRFGPGDRALYAYDASIFRQLPLGVVVPRHAEDVVAAIGVCRRFGAPVFARGGGTGLTGQTVNHAVCFDFSKYLNEIVELDPGRRQALVQPGVICDQLRDAAAAHGLTFGPDPATHDHATLGGMIGNNSCGTHSLVSGKTVDNIDELEVLTYDGTRMWVGATDEAELERVVAAGGRRGRIYAALRQIRDTYADEIRTGMPDIPPGFPDTTWTSCCRRTGSTWPGRWSGRSRRSRSPCRPGAGWCRRLRTRRWSSSGTRTSPPRPTPCRG